jgi:hypothetical protein
MKLAKQLLAAAIGLSAAASAQAQTVTWSTSGAFSGCGMADAGATWVSCTVGTTTLRYDFNTGSTVSLIPALPVSSGNFGSFVMSGGGLAVQSFAGVSFDMYINQIVPTPGNQAVTGSVSGNVITQGGQLFWGPIAPPSFMIDNITYSLDVDAATQSIRINPPGLRGEDGEVQTVRGTIVPEPASFTLVFAGLAGLGFVARRRQRA